MKGLGEENNMSNTGEGAGHTKEPWKATVVDGTEIKADTWYMLKDGKFVEVSQ